MEGMLDHLQYWHWWILGLLLLILEIFSPAAFFMWMGIGAGLTGLVLMLIPDLSWETQFIVFAILIDINIDRQRPSDNGMRRQGNIFNLTINRRVNRSANERIVIADYLTGTNAVTLFNERVTRRTNMLAQHHHNLFRLRE